ncbi:Regulatory protein AtoC [subsurface metagenome]
MERAIILSSGKIILLEDLSSRLWPTFPPKELSSPSLEEAERKYILDALQATHGNQTRAAHLLGIHRTTLSRKLKRYGIRP